MTEIQYTDTIHICGTTQDTIHIYDKLTVYVIDLFAEQIYILEQCRYFFRKDKSCSILLIISNIKRICAQNRYCGQ